jgi:hypothetical protein
VHREHANRCFRVVVVKRRRQAHARRACPVLFWLKIIKWIKLTFSRIFSVDLLLGGATFFKKKLRLLIANTLLLVISARKLCHPTNVCAKASRRSLSMLTLWDFFSSIPTLVDGAGCRKWRAIRIRLIRPALLLTLSKEAEQPGDSDVTDAIDFKFT